MTSAPRDPHVVALAAVAAAVVAAYANSFDGGLVLDARALILENPELRQATLTNVLLLVSRDYWQPLGTDGLYRPLATLSYLFNYAILGNAGRPFGYHAVNLLLHLACTGCLYALVRALTRSPAVATAAAALFGLHPVATEAVTNIAGRPDLLATLGVLAGLVCHVRLTRAEGSLRVRCTLGLLLAALVAFFSKESGLVLVPVVVAYDLVFRSRRAARPWQMLGPEHVVLGAAAATYLAARWAVARAGLPPDDISPIDNPIVEAGFWSGRLTGVKVLGRALTLLVWPRALSADYSFAQIPVVSLPPRAWEDWGALLALVVLVALVGIALRLRRTAPALAFFLLFMLLALLPTANLLLVIGSIMADRFLFLPLAGFAGAVAVLGDRLAARQRSAAGVVALVVLLALGVRTAARNRDWRNEVTLWQSAVQVSPESAKAHKAYAAALFAADPDHPDLERVIAEAERAVVIRPDYLLALIDLGGYYIRRGDENAAEGRDGSSWYNRAVPVLERGRVLDRAANRRFAQKMVATGRASGGIPQIGNVEVHQNLALAYLRLGRFTDALTAYEGARDLDPTNPSRYIDISVALLHLGRWEDAAVALFQAVTIRPEDREAPSRLVDVYRTFDPSGHEIVTDAPDRVTVNLDDPVVHRNRCAAFAGLVPIFTQANQPGAVAQVQRLYAQHCSDDA